MPEKRNPSQDETAQIIYTPQEAAFVAVEGVKAAREGLTRAISLPASLGELATYFAPVAPGQIAVVQAQTSQFKSGFMRFWQTHAAEQLARENRQDEAIVHVSTEELIEEQVYYQMERYSGEQAGLLARGQVGNWDRLINASATIAGVPIYRIGDSLARPSEYSHLYLTNVARAIKALQAGEITGNATRIAIVYVDYLQALPIDPEIRSRGKLEEQRRLQVRQDVYRLKEMAKFFGCPVVVGCQAKQELEHGSKSGWQMPGLYDGSETASIAERFDRVLCLWMPKQTSTVGARIEKGDLSFVVEENQLLIKVAKQRGGLPAGKIFANRINFATGEVLADPNFGTIGVKFSRDVVVPDWYNQ